MVLGSHLLVIWHGRGIAGAKEAAICRSLPALGGLAALHVIARRARPGSRGPSRGGQSIALTVGMGPNPEA